MENIDREYNPLVTIIIPCRQIDNYTKRCIIACQQLPEDKEIIVVTDEDCPGYPSAKRNWAMNKARGKYFAFIDSDAYPPANWLTIALQWLEDGIPALCGPGVLPPDSPFMEQVADLVFRCLPYGYRVTPRHWRIVKEYPTFNLIVNRKYATPFENLLTGEDSIFCRRIKHGIMYQPLLKVYHSRRPAFRPLWKQVGTYGRHRGYLIKLAVLAWISTVWTYVINFFKGLFGRRPS